MEPNKSLQVRQLKSGFVLFDFIKFIGDFLHYNKFDQFLDTSKSIG
jgi:hypothetical protein